MTAVTTDSHAGIDLSADVVFWEDGSVSDETLDAINTWAGTPEQLVSAVEVLLGMLDDADGSGGGVVDVDDDELEDVVHVTVISNGPDADLVVNALDLSAFGVAYWSATYRNGCHVYEVPFNAWRTPQAPARAPVNQYDVGTADAIADVRPAVEDLIVALGPTGELDVALAAKIVAVRRALDVAAAPTGRPD